MELRLLEIRQNQFKMSKVIIIAEAGVNHNGSIETAIKLIDAAAEAGVDYIKFQTFKASSLASIHSKKAKYQIENCGNDQGQLEMLKNLELSYQNHLDLSAYCETKKIKFFSTAFDIDSLIFLKQIGLKIVKIPSGEITNLPYLRKAATLFSEVIISTGMSTIKEINDALEIFLTAGIRRDRITILHCNTEYPTPMNDVNLRAMFHIKEELKVNIGYSDHTLGIEVPIAAVGLGAKIVEKHFTLDKSLPGPDHKASLNPLELKNMVMAIRNIELAIAGNGVKQVSDSEIKNMAVVRKSIVAKSVISKGETFTEFNLTTKRPGDGISPMLWDKVIGQKAKRNFEIDEQIKL